MSPKKIIELEFLGPPAVGGVETYVKELAKSFKQKKYPVEIWSSDLLDFYWNRDKKRNGNFEGIPVKKFKAFSLPIPPRIIIPSLFFKFLFMKRLDYVIHTHSLGFHTIAALIFYNKFRKVFVNLQYNHELMYKHSKTLKGKFVFSILKHYGNKKKVEIISTNKYEKKAYASLGIPSEVIPNAANIEEFDSISEKNIKDIKKEYGLNKKFVILFAGRVDPVKGVDVLVKAFKNMPKNCLLVIAGREFTGYGAHLKKLAKDLSISDKIIFTGSMPRKKYKVFFKCCDLFVLPSRNETFSLAIIEAFTCSKPVIGSIVGATPELVQDCGLVFEKDNVKQLHEAMIKLYDNPKLRKKMGEKGRKRVIKELNFDAVAKKHINLF